MNTIEIFGCYFFKSSQRLYLMPSLMNNNHLWWEPLYSVKRFAIKSLQQSRISGVCWLREIENINLTYLL